MTRARGHWQRTAAVAFWLLLLGSYFLALRTSGLGPWELAREAGGFLTQSTWGPVLYILLYAVRPVFLFSAAVLTVAGGAFFGPWWGTLYTLLGSNLSASLAYLLGRLLGFESESPDERLKSYFRALRERSFETVFLLRLMFVPYDLVNYAAGFLHIRFWPFLFATALGSLPGTISFVLFGASSGLQQGAPTFDPRIFLLSLLIFVVSLATARFVRQTERGKESSGE